MKRIISAVLVLAMLFSLCSCSANVSNTKLTMGILNTVTNLDPLNISGDGERIIATNCFEGLLRFDSKGKIDLGGATAYSISKDGLTYVFKLNPLAKWYVSDAVKATIDTLGIEKFDNKITAEDYIFGITRFIQSSNKALSSVKGASTYDPDDKESTLGLKAIDEYTLEITLERVDPDFLYKLAANPVYPCDNVLVEKLESIFSSTPATILCNGPYYIKNVTESEAVLERNPDYTGKIQVSNGSILLYTTGKRQTLATRFEEGQYDIYLTPSTGRLKDKTTSYTSTSAIWGFAFNCKSNVGSIAALRDIILSTVYYDKIELPKFATSKAERIIPGVYNVGDTSYASFNPQKLAYERNIELAKENLDKLLDKMDREAFTIKLAIPKDMEKTMEPVIIHWETLFEEKVIIDLRVYETKDYATIASEGSYDLAILPITPYKRTALGVVEAFAGAPCYYADQKINALKSQTKASAEENAANYAKAEKIVVENGAFVPLFYASNDLYLGKGVSGVYIADGGRLIYLHSGTKVTEE